MGASDCRFFLSCDLNSPITFCIEKLDGNLRVKKSTDSGVVSIAEEKKSELYIDCALYIDGAPFGLPLRTRLKTTGPPYCWNELITLSCKYRDFDYPFTICDHSMGCFVWEAEGFIGGATILLFNSKTQMKSGKQKLRLWQEKEADSSFSTSTPGKVSDKSQR